MNFMDRFSPAENIRLPSKESTNILFLKSFFTMSEEGLDVKMTIFIYSFLLVTCIRDVTILRRLAKLGEL